MKTAIIILGEVRQVVFMPENEADKAALRAFEGNCLIEAELKRGALYDNGARFGVRVSECNGGYLRAYDDEDTLNLVIKPK